MRTALLASSLFGLSAVALGAFGAHALRETLEFRQTSGTWETAVLYHLVHAVALLALGVTQPASVSPWLGRAAIAWVIGIILFSGSLYILAVGGPRLLGPVTPLGGVGFLAGWACVLMHARTLPPRSGS